MRCFEVDGALPQTSLVVSVYRRDGGQVSLEVGHCGEAKSIRIQGRNEWKQSVFPMQTFLQTKHLFFRSDQ